LMPYLKQYWTEQSKVTLVQQIPLSTPSNTHFDTFFEAHKKIPGAVN
jgi:hypothetical protein